MALNRMIARSKCGGQALVEAALSITLILLIVMGIIEFGRMMFVYNQMENAARNGARWAVVQPTSGVTASSIQTQLSKSVIAIPGGTPYVKVQVCNPTAPGAPSPVTCDSTYWTTADSSIGCSSNNGPSPTPVAGGSPPSLIRVRTCASVGLFIPGLFSQFLGNPRTVNGVAIFQYEL